MRWMMLSMAAAALVVAGCASFGSGGAEVDTAYVARIENAAKNAGVSVYWINYPTKSTSSIN
jgi:hypothetical protein